MERLLSEERQLRHDPSLTAQQLLDFCEQLIQEALEAAHSNKVALASALASRCEMLTRHPPGSRVRGTDEDWFVLIPTKMNKKELAAVNDVRRQLHVQALQNIAFVNRSMERYVDAELALQEAMAEGGEDNVRPQTLLNLLSVVSCIPGRFPQVLQYAAEATARVSSEMERLTSSDMGTVLISGTVSQREEYTQNRRFQAMMLSSAMFYPLLALQDLCSDATQFAKMPPEVRIVCVNRVTLQFSSLERFCASELGEEHEVTRNVREHLLEWSGWLGTYCGGQEALMDPNSKWKYQQRRAAQLESMQLVRCEQAHPALGYLHQRCPYWPCTSMLLMSAPSHSEHSEPKSADSLTKESPVLAPQTRDGGGLPTVPAAVVSSTSKRTGAQPSVDSEGVSTPHTVAVNREDEYSAFRRLSNYVVGGTAAPRLSSRQSSSSHSPVDQDLFEAIHRGAIQSAEDDCVVACPQAVAPIAKSSKKANSNPSSRQQPPKKVPSSSPPPRQPSDSPVLAHDVADSAKHVPSLSKPQFVIQSQAIQSTMSGVAAKPPQEKIRRAGRPVPLSGPDTSSLTPQR